jgi:tetratricopeptide (TPR) repeat protein
LPSVKASYKYLLLLGLLLFPAGCSVEKNTRATRFYHGLTARYNIYFNGYESFKAGLLKVTNGYNDDYAELLKVFEYSDPASASRCNSEMDQAIQKASKLISLKSITARPEISDKGKPAPGETDLLNRKEYNEWVDDSYLLIGKSRFCKHEFNEAAAVFSYCITEANDPLIRKEASVWLSRIYNETGKYSDSYRVLNELDITSESSRSLKGMYYTTLADLFIKQKKYPEAIDPLDRSLDFIIGKRTKYRLTYLLAELNELAGNPAKATSLYRKVVKMNPPYDVEFNARINIAGVFDINSGNPEEIKKELGKMLKDSKNKDFHDQIYYSLANLSMKEGNEKEAVEYFRKSASSPTSNQNQKSRSYLALADYYYNKPDFMKAGKYYDSTIFFLNQSHPDYQLLKTKSEDLNSVVSQLTVIQTEDSLQKVAAMPESERNSLISSIINEIVKAETEGKKTDYSDRFNMGQYYENERRFQGNIEQEGKWYFYNQAALTFGRTEFRRRYGDRKLEDNWRRANKATATASQSAGGTEENGQNKTDTSKAVFDYKNPEFYLRNLPLTDTLMAASNERMATAYLNAGKAYAERIADPQRATESFETLIKRFPSNELVPEALYNLYKVSRESNSSTAEAYRQRLLEKHPSTEFAKILSDPGYYEKKLADMKMAEKLYSEAYNTYAGENFTTAISLIDEALTKYSQDILAPKFLLLRAYSVARITDERTFRDELNKLIKAWPDSEESKKAAEIIAYLNEKLPELKVEEEKVIAKELFVADTAKIHVVALIIADPRFNLATFDVISYNIDNYTNKNYRTEGTLVDNKYIMIIVSGFSKYSQAIDYYHTFNIEKNVRNSSGSRMYTFVISSDNLNVLNKDKNPDRYLLFFKENYLK